MTISAGTARFAERYSVVRRLGAGGMATVYLAEDERLGRPVAVKRLHADSPEDVARRFAREARMGASLNHPNLVAVYDTVTDPEGVLIVMEFVDGPSLEDALEDGGLPRSRVPEVLGDLAAALDHVHARGIVHRDLKPANVLLRGDGRAKLADLGIAVAVEESAHLTHTGAVLGTAAYMAPEQLQGRPVSPAADVYALAAVAFEMLAGRPAQPGDTPLEVAYRVETEPPPDLREAWPQAPAEVAQALLAAMAANPGDRPASAGELVEALRSGLGRGRGGAGAARRRSEIGGAARAAAGGAAAGAGAAGALAGTDGRGARDLGAPPVGAAGAAGDAGGATAAALPTHAATGDTASGGPDGLPNWSQVTRHGTHPSKRARFIPVLALALLVALAVAVLATSFGSSGDQAGRDGGPGSGEPRAGAATALSAAETVTTFYRRASAGDYRGAWRLAAPKFRRQLGGYEGFRARMAPLESVAFRRADPIAEPGGSARVNVRAVADYTDGVDRCRGALRLVRGGPSGWLIEAASVSCPQSTRPNGAGGLGTEEQLQPDPAATETTVAPDPQPVAPEPQGDASGPTQTEPTAPAEPAEPADTQTRESAPTERSTGTQTESRRAPETDSGPDGAGDGDSAAGDSGGGTTGDTGGSDGSPGRGGADDSGSSGTSTDGSGE